VGGFVSAHWVAHHVAGAHRGPGRGGPRAMLHHLEKRLDFTPDQSKQIETILERQRGRMDALRDSTHAEIERVLTPEQRARFRELERRLLRFGPPPGAPGNPPPGAPGD